MGNVSNLLANSLRSSALAGYDNAAEKRFGAFDVTLLLFSNFATVHPKLLPFYAEQYGIGSFVQTEEQTRALLARIIGLYRKKGTPWAMKQALEILGYPDAEIIEGGPAAPALFYNGEVNYDGQFQYGGGNWATFRVILHLHGAPAPTLEGRTALQNVIEEFKPARCVLLSLTTTA